MRTASAVALAGLFLSAAPSYALTTSVNDTWPSQPGGTGEWDLYDSGNGTQQAGIMEYLYGSGDFTRVDDANDIQWQGSSGGATFLGIYSGYGQSLYTAGLSGQPISSLIVGGPAYSGPAAPSRSSGAVSYTPVSQPFLFLDETTGGAAYSSPSVNGGVDRMVTFEVNGYLATPGVESSLTPFSDGTQHYVIAFEDGVDFDFNDLVVEVSGVMPLPGQPQGGQPQGGQQSAVPEASTPLDDILAFSSCGIIGIRRLQNRKSRS